MKYKSITSVCAALCTFFAVAFVSAPDVFTSNMFPSAEGLALDLSRQQLCWRAYNKAGVADENHERIKRFGDLDDWTVSALYPINDYKNTQRR